MADEVVRFTVGITGHRHFKEEGQRQQVRRNLTEVLSKLRQQNKHPFAISALAVGADTMFAEIALDLGFALTVVIPFEEYEEDFDAAELAVYRSLKSRASDVHKMPDRERSDPAYLAAGKWMVKQIDALIAVWDGKPARGLGGTADVVRFALSAGLEVWHINPESGEAGLIAPSADASKGRP